MKRHVILHVDLVCDHSRSSNYELTHIVVLIANKYYLPIYQPSKMLKFVPSINNSLKVFQPVI